MSARLTVHMIVRGADDASAWYQEVFGATERSRVPLPDGRLIHVEVDFGEFSLMLADEFPEQAALAPAAGTPLPAALYVHTGNVDELWSRALAAGATAVRGLADMFWGEREGQFIDPFGYRWGVTQHIADVTHADLVAGVAAMFGGTA
jgi:PhnB protein